MNKRNSPHQYRTVRLGFERLEDRCLLAAAVGLFERTDGFVRVFAAAVAEVDEEVGSAAEDEGTVLAQESRSAADDGESGSAFAHNDGTALCVTPIDGETAVPQLSAASTHEVAATDFASAGAGSDANIAIANGDFLYHADPGFPNNLVFHGHFLSRFPEVKSLLNSRQLVLI